MTPLVSIVIPAYNAEQFIGATLESALAQTHRRIEVIVVDDGSQDDTLAVARKYQSEKVKVISQANGRASAARNRALGEAQGDFIQYLDADDLLAPDKIERQLDIAREGNGKWVVSGEWARFCVSLEEAVFNPQSLWADMTSVEWLICSWTENLMMPNHAWLVPRAVADQAGFWNESLSQGPNDDGEYFCRVVLASEEVKFCSGAKCYYRSGQAGSLSQSPARSAAARRWAFISYELSADHLLAYEDSPRTRLACAALFQHFLYDRYPSIAELTREVEAKIRHFGGGAVEPSGGNVFQALSKIVGWKLAKRVQLFAQQHGYKREIIQ